MMSQDERYYSHLQLQTLINAQPSLEAIEDQIKRNERVQERYNDVMNLLSEDNVGEVSDGYHTFNSLYEQRCYLFAALVNTFKDQSWKSHKHANGEECFGGGWFIVGIDTPEGSYTYHYKDEFWDLFHCVELPVGKEWDGHTEKDVTRLMSLETLNKKQQRINRIKTVEMALCLGK